MKIQEKYYSSIGKYPLNQTLLVKSIDDNLANSRDARSRVRCGATGHLDALIANLVKLRDYISEYGNIFN